MHLTVAQRRLNIGVQSTSKISPPPEISDGIIVYLLKMHTSYKLKWFSIYEFVCCCTKIKVDGVDGDLATFHIK